jgi:hypothetical protein
MRLRQAQFDRLRMRSVLVDAKSEPRALILRCEHGKPRSLILRCEQSEPRRTRRIVLLV